MGGMELSNVKGTRDLGPADMVGRNEVIAIVKRVYESYGFQPLETPALENWDVLSAKGTGGRDIIDQTYNFKDKSGRRLGLRYDLTVSLARYVAMNKQLAMPFKRYQYGKAWRYEEIKKGRYREFYQFDIDTVGSSSMLADAEIIACTVDAVAALGFKGFKVRINNRKLLDALLKYAGVKKVSEALRAIDKLDKLGVAGVKKELNERGINKKSVEKVMKFVKISGKPDAVLKKAEKLVGKCDGVKELKELVGYLRMMGTASYEIDLSLARGMEYYTGPVFEVDYGSIGSIGGGGRYDRMIGIFAEKEVPATGISLGIDRIVELRKSQKKTVTDIFIAVVGNTLKEALKLARKLRKKNLNVELDLLGRSLSKQFDYANSKGIPKVIIVGEKDLKKGFVTEKDMKTGKQKRVRI
jgi:histidyl-tRNA synthetase